MNVVGCVRARDIHPVSAGLARYIEIQKYLPVNYDFKRTMNINKEKMQSRSFVENKVLV